MMEMLDGFIGVGIFLIIGTVAANFLFQTIRPKWSREKHILYCSMLPAFGVWLLVSSVLTISVFPQAGFAFEFVIPIVVLAIVFPFMGAFFGIPTSWLILKQMGWKDSKSLDDIFE